MRTSGTRVRDREQIATVLILRFYAVMLNRCILEVRLRCGDQGGVRSPMYGGPGSPVKFGNDEGSGKMGNGCCRLDPALAAPTRFLAVLKWRIEREVTLDPKKLTRFAYIRSQLGPRCRATRKASMRRRGVVADVIEGVLTSVAFARGNPSGACPS